MRWARKAETEPERSGRVRREGQCAVDDHGMPVIPISEVIDGEAGGGRRPEARPSHILAYR